MSSYYDWTEYGRSKEAVFQIELQPSSSPQASSGADDDNGTLENTDVIMRNVVRPASFGSHEVTHTSLQRQRNMSGPRGDDSKGPEPSDVSDGFEVFTEDNYANLTGTNQYQIRKMACQTLMDVALMMANISQLRTLLSLGESLVQYYQVLLTLVIFSLACQVTFGILMFIIWVRESDQHQKEDFLNNLKELESTKSIPITTTERARRSLMNRQKAFDHKLVTNRLNYFTMVLVFFITITNMFITGFGIKTVDIDKAT